MTGMTAVMGRIAQIANVVASPRTAGGFAGVLAAHVDVSPAQYSATRPSGLAPSVSLTAVGTTPNNPALPPAAWQWMTSIDRAARAEGVDPKLLTALVWTESSFSPTAVSPAGAIGLTQLMPPTAEMLEVDPYDPEQNLRGGARFLRHMIDRFGRVDHALAAYNAGPTRIASTLSAGEPITVGADYAQTVIDRYHALGGTQ